MGGGALIHLVARGPQDALLTGNPTTTFFKSCYRRHSPFALEAVRQTPQGDARWGGRTSLAVSRNGDVLLGVTLEITMRRGAPDVSPFFPAEDFVKRVELEVGGTVVDTLTRDWMRMHYELFRPAEDKAAYQRRADFVDGEPPGTLKTFFLELPFWFARAGPAAALPTLALQYHEVRLNIEFGECPPGVDPAFEPLVEAWADFAYLCTEERRALLAAPQLDYLIEQVQVVERTLSPGDKPESHRVDLTFNHPCKFLAWALCGPRFGQFSAGAPGEHAEAYAPLRAAVLQINGVDRFAKRRGAYFTLLTTAQAGVASPAAGVYFYSFGLHPADALGSGTLNFSRVDSAALVLDLKAATQADPDGVFAEDQTLASATAELKVVRVFAVNYNQAVVRNGMLNVVYNS